MSGSFTSSATKAIEILCWGAVCARVGWEVGGIFWHVVHR